MPGLLWVGLVIAAFFPKDARSLEYLPGLSLSTDSVRADVAMNGTVADVWRFSTAEPQRSFDSQEGHIDFFLYMERGYATHHHGSAAVNVDDVTVATPRFDASSTHSGTITEQPKRFRLFYNCRSNGSVIISATIPVENANPLRWMWRKACSNDLASHVFVGFSDSDRGSVVNDGVVSAGWSPSSPNYLQTAFDPRLQLVVLSLENQAFAQPRLDVDPPIASASVSGHFDPQRSPSAPTDYPANEPVAYVAKNQRFPLIIDITCSEPGLVVVTAELVLYPRHAPYASIKFAWKHQCGGVPRRHLIVSSTITHEGVDPADADVAQDGALVPAWAPSTYVAGPQQEVTFIHFAMHTPSDGSHASPHELQGMLVPILTVDPPIATAMVVDMHGMEVETSAPAAVSEHWTTLGVRLICNTAHEHDANVTLRLRPGVFNPVDVTFRKLCGGFKEGLIVTVPTVVLDGAGDAEELSNSTVVRDGRPTAAWDARRPSAVVSADTDTVVFTVVLGQGVPGARLPNNTASVRATHAVGSGAPSSRRILHTRSRVGLSARLEASRAPPRPAASPLPFPPLHTRSGVQRVEAASIHLADDGDDWLEFAANSVLLAGGDFLDGTPYDLSVSFACPSLGWFPSLLSGGFAGSKATVRVAVTLSSFHPVNFAFQKHCAGWIQRPLGIVVFGVFVVLLGLGVYFLVKKWRAVRKAASKYMSIDQEISA